MKNEEHTEIRATMMKKCLQAMDEFLIFINNSYNKRTSRKYYISAGRLNTKCDDGLFDVRKKVSI